MQRLKDAICDLVSIAEEVVDKQRFQELDNAGVEIINILDNIEKLKNTNTNGLANQINNANDEQYELIKAKLNETKENLFKTKELIDEKLSKIKDIYEEIQKEKEKNNNDSNN